MVQSGVLQLARQGNPEAISTLINDALQLKGVLIEALQGVRAQVALNDHCLAVTLESDRVPDEQVLLAFIRHGLLKLKLSSIESVKAYGKQIGESYYAWSQEVSPWLTESSTSTEFNTGTESPAQPSTSFQQQRRVWVAPQALALISLPSHLGQSWGKRLTSQVRGWSRQIVAWMIKLDAMFTRDGLIDSEKLNPEESQNLETNLLVILFVALWVCLLMLFYVDYGSPSGRFTFSESGSSKAQGKVWNSLECFLSSDNFMCD